MKKNTLFSQAYAYTLNGFSVIPVGKDKKPLLKSWKQYQTTAADEAQIEAWWEQWPDANIGIVTGKISGITVVDVDTHAGGDVSPFPKTYTVKTGNGGVQLYYQYHSGLSISANAYAEFPHVDIRSDGGFVVAPPSIITPKVKGANGVYEITDPQEPQPFPAHLFPAKKKRPLRTLAGVAEGGRNDSLAAFVGTIIKTMPEDRWVPDVLPLVRRVNATYTPPLPDHEVDAVFTSITSSEAAQRREGIPSPLQVTPEQYVEITLRRNKNNQPYKDMVNVYQFIAAHPKLKDAIKYNAFKQDVEFNDELFSESHLLEILRMVQTDTLQGVTKTIVYDAVQKYAFDHTYDEVTDWLESLVWDGVPRIATWLPRVTGVEETEYHKSVGCQWFLGLVGRMAKPGMIFDNVLVLVGAQKLGKTSLFRILGGDWYRSFSGSMDNKDFYLALRGGVIVDLDEGVAMYRNESIKIKTIITQTVDEFRAPYERTTRRIPRRFVFSMSTNDLEPFRDTTGNRRYWPVDLHQVIDFKWLEDNRSQLFAEAYYAHKHHLLENYPQVPEDEALIHQERHLPQDEWTDIIQDYVMQSYEYCTGSEEYVTTIAEIYDKALRGDRLERLERKHEMRIGSILRSVLGLEKRRFMINGVLKNRFVISDAKREELQKNPLRVVPDF